MITLPFNNNPSVTDYGNPARSYTCPADKFALITVALSLNVFGDWTANAHLGLSSDLFSTNNNESESFSFWVKAGDVVAVTESISSTTDTTVSISVLLEVEGTSSCSCTLNTNTICQLSIKTKTRWTTGTNVSAGASTLAIDGVTNADFVVNEYSLT